jgi:hypothetical protein
MEMVMMAFVCRFRTWTVRRGDNVKKALIAFSILCLPLPAIAAAARTGPSVVATLMLPHARVLPGVPFDLEIALKNNSERTVKVGLLGCLEVTLPDGSRFQPVPRSACTGLMEANGDSFVELAPGQTDRRMIDLKWDRPDWLCDSEFAGPGAYELALELKIGNTYGDDLSNYVGPIRTSSARLERVLPPGEDEAIWKKMQQMAGGRWPGTFDCLKGQQELAREIIALHPASGYYPYALLLERPVRDAQDISKLLEASERFSDSPARAYLIAAAGHAAYVEAGHARHDRDNVRAMRYARMSEEYYRAALATGEAGVKANAESVLPRVRKELELARGMPDMP